MKQLRGTDLKRFLRAYKRAHPPLGEIVALLQNVEYAMNVGSVFRLADGCALNELILSGITPRHLTPPSPRWRGARTAASPGARSSRRKSPWPRCAPRATASARWS